MALRTKISLYATLGVVVLLLTGTLSSVKADTSDTPHGITSANTDLCEGCHLLHAAQTDKLGGEASLNEICLACHDGTVGFNIEELYTSSDTYAGHKTETSGTVPAGSAIDCVGCHKPHGYISQNGYLMRTSIYAEDGATRKTLESTTTRDFRDVCVICHEVEAAISRTRFLGINIANLATDTASEIAHLADETVQCKTCHNLATDAGAAHSPTLITGGDTTEAEALNIAGADTTDSSGSAEVVVVFSGNVEATVLEWLDLGLAPGMYRTLIRAQAESTSTRFTGRINTLDTTPAYPVLPNTWEYLSLGDVTIGAAGDDFRLQVLNASDTTSALDRVYFLKYEN